MNPSTVVRPFRPTYAHATKAKANTYLFISGQVPWDREGNIVGKGDPEAQTRQVLENIKAIVEAAGGTMDNIVNIGLFLTDVKHLEAVHKARAQYFKKDPPASTLVQVSQLISPDFLVEINAIAALD